MAEKSDHSCSAYTLKDGNLVCVGCGAPSKSTKWRENVFGKAIEQAKVENKGRVMPPESKRLEGRP